MKKLFDYTLDSMNQFPIASFLFIISITLYFYTNRISDLIKENSDISVDEIDGGWGLNVRQCTTEPDLMGSYTECDDVLISEIYDTEEAAEKEKQRILKSIQNDLERKDVLNFRYLGSFFIYFPCIIIAGIAIYDVMRLKNKNKTIET